MGIRLFTDDVVHKHCDKRIVVLIPNRFQDFVIACLNQKLIKEVYIAEIEEKLFLFPLILFQGRIIMVISDTVFTCDRIIGEHTSFPVAEDMIFLVNHPADILLVFLGYP